MEKKIHQSNDPKLKYEYIEAFERLESSEIGLSEKEVEYRQLKYGLNLLVNKTKKSLFRRILEEFKDLMVIILIIAATIALFANEIADSVIIYIVVLINGLIGFGQKYKAEKAIEALQKMVSPQARVIRHGKQELIDTQGIVPGDILVLSEGDNISADGIIFEYSEFATQEAALTGESTPVSKFNFDTNPNSENILEKSNAVFMGTAVAHGNAKVIVTKTGMQTEFGKIATLTQETKKDLSPLEKEIKSIGIFSAKVTMLFTILLILVTFFIHKKSLIDTIIFATSVAVAAVPEGLPATITIALALGVQRLSKQKAIVKQLSSVETLGATTVICSDKTGTLTKNEMTVTNVFIDGYFIEMEGVGYAPIGKIKIFEKEKEIQLNSFLSKGLELSNLVAILCSNTEISEKDNQYKVLGDPTEGALITMAQKFGANIENINEEYTKIHELPFDSDRKRMSIIVQSNKTGKVFILTKGGAENIIKICDQRIHRAKANILTKDSKEELFIISEQFAANALRTLAFAYKEIDSKTIEKIFKNETLDFKQLDLEKNLTFICITGMIDPPRPEVKDAVKLTKQAGIKTYVLTGDHGLTAKAICKQLRLITDDEKNIVITGDELNKLADFELKDILKNKELGITFARISPEHKLRIVSALKENGEVVAVTGDGVNDAPALKRADIGIAMGIAGTDVSKEAANMVLSDDSYSTIVNAIKEGRNIYENLRKFIFYIFSSNIGEVLTIFLAIISGIPMPFTAGLILCVNLVTDLFPALALSTEPADLNIMNQPPRNPNTKIMNKAFIFRLFYIGIFIAITVIGIYITDLMQSGWTYGKTPDDYIYSHITTLAFGSIVFMQLINTLNAKSETESIFKMNLLGNKKLIWAILSSGIICLGIIYIPIFNNFLNTNPLTIFEVIELILSGLIILFVEEIRKFFIRHYGRKQRIKPLN